MENCVHRTPCGWCDRLDKECKLIVSDDVVTLQPYIPPSVLQTDPMDLSRHIPIPCRGCSNHPSNGGSGICNCTLPYFGDTDTTDTALTALKVNGIVDTANSKLTTNSDNLAD
jgi:hypothetical protein